jgi:hypothetical protein
MKIFNGLVLALGVSFMPLHNATALPAAAAGKFALDVGRGVLVDLISDAIKEMNFVTPAALVDQKKQLAELQARVADLQQKLTQSKDSSPDVVWMREGLVKLQALYAQAQDRTSILEKELALLRKIQLDKPTVQPRLDFQVSYVTRKPKSSTSVAFGNGSVLQSGDLYKVIFTPKQDAYIYVFQLDSANKLEVLFPVKEVDGFMLNHVNPVKAGKTYFLPKEDISYPLDTQTGSEQIYFIASSEPDTVLEHLARLLEQARKQQRAPAEKLIQAQLMQVMKTKGFAALVNDSDSQPVQWQEQGQHFSTLQQRLKDLCQGCVQVMSFEHR